MRTRSTTPRALGSLLFALGSLLALGALLVALSPGESTAAPVYKVTLPGLSGDDSSGATYATPGANPTASPTAGATPIPGSCNYDRATVKTLSDPAANFIRAENSTSVALLNLISRPGGVTANRLAPHETSIFGINAELVSMQLNASRELVLLISDPSSTKSMLVFFPHKDCTKGAAVEDQVAMNLARTALTNACGEASVFAPKVLQGRATIRGAGFWGPQGGQGAAANGLELHPVTSFTYTSATHCDPNIDGPVTPPTPVPPSPLQQLVASAGPGLNKPGDAVTLSVQTVPVFANLDCEMRYYEPSDSVPFSPTLTAMKKTNEAGYATWTFNIPLVTPYGRSRVEGRCLDRSGSTFIWVEAP